MSNDLDKIKFTFIDYNEDNTQEEIPDETYEMLKKEVISKTESEKAEVKLKENLNQKDIDER